MRFLSSAVTLAVACLSVTGSAQPTDKKEAQDLSGGYIIEFELGNDKAALLDTVKQYGKVHMEMTYSLFSGVSVELYDTAAANIAKLKSLPGVKNAWPIGTITVSQSAKDSGNQQTNLQKQTTQELKRGALESRAEASESDDSPESPKAAGYTAHIMTQVDKLHAKGVTGKGSKIAIIDTGIDYKHPALGGCFGKDCVVIGGYDLVGDNFTYTDTPKPDNDPMDQNGGGTRNAGVVAAQPNNRVEGFVGSAPGAKLLAYKITGKDGYTRSDILVAALHRAYDDGASIILASSIVGAGWRDEAAALAASQIVAKGVPVIAPVDDHRDYGLFFTPSSAAGTGVVAVTPVFSNDIAVLMYRSSFTIGGGKSQSFAYQDIGSNSIGDNIKADLWSPPADAEGDACSTLPSNTPNLGKFVVLVKEGGCGLRRKLTILEEKGASQILFYRDGPGVLTDDSYVGPREFTGAVMADIGENWAKQIKDGKTVTVDIVRTRKAKIYLEKSFTTPSGRTWSPGAFVDGTWGPTADMGLKPQFGAPGEGIVSTTMGGLFDVLGPKLPSDGSYSGQAAAYVAGVYALLADGRSVKQPKILESLLSTTAKAQLYTDSSNHYLSYLAPVPKQGAGLIQASDAFQSTLSIQPASISFGDSDHAVNEAQFSMTNNHKMPITYKLNVVNTKSAYVFSGDGDDPTSGYPVTVNNKTATLQLSQSQVTLQPGQSASIKIRSTDTKIPYPEQLPFWSGWVTINGTDGTNMVVPYQGLAGSLFNTNMFESDKGVVLSYIRHQIKENDTLEFPASGGGRYLVNWSVRLPSARLSLEILSSATGKAVGRMPVNPSVKVGRGAPKNFYWKDGKTVDGKLVPEGKYRLRARALRLYGDENQESHWSTTESVNFNIKYVKPE